MCRSSQGGREAKVDHDQPLVGGSEGASWASRSTLNSGSLGNSAGPRLRQCEEKQVFRALAKLPCDLSQAADSSTEQCL